MHPDSSRAWIHEKIGLQLYTHHARTENSENKGVDFSTGTPSVVSSSSQRQGGHPRTSKRNAACAGGLYSCSTAAVWRRSRRSNGRVSHGVAVEVRCRALRARVSRQGPYDRAGSARCQAFGWRPECDGDRPLVEANLHPQWPGTGGAGRCLKQRHWMGRLWRAWGWRGGDGTAGNELFFDGRACAAASPRSLWDARRWSLHGQGRGPQREAVLWDCSGRLVTAAYYAFGQLLV